MTDQRRRSTDVLRGVTRRHFFETASFGIGGVALASLMGDVVRAQSVNPAALRRSSTTRSNAFLSAATRAAVRISAESVAECRRLSALAMQPACRGSGPVVGGFALVRFRRVKSVLFNMLTDGLRHEARNGTTFSQVSPDLGG